MHVRFGEFTARLREYDGNVDDMIYMAQPISYDEANALLASLRQQIPMQARQCAAVSVPHCAARP
jgi:hypothetical protein